jgi:hypothetical protein
MSPINAIRIQAQSNRFPTISNCTLSRLLNSDSKVPAESTSRCCPEHPTELNNNVDAHASYLATTVLPNWKPLIHPIN